MKIKYILLFVVFAVLFMVLSYLLLGVIYNHTGIFFVVLLTVLVSVDVALLVAAFARFMAGAPDEAQ